MNKMQAQVMEFHKAFGLTIGKSPLFRETDLRLDLITEELLELDEAIENKNFPEAIDAICDILYVVFGTAVTFGIDIEPFFDEVHKTNMAKLGGNMREDGKLIKPKDWQPPRIKEMLGEIYK